MKRMASCGGLHGAMMDACIYVRTHIKDCPIMLIMLCCCAQVFSPIM